MKPTSASLLSVLRRCSTFANLASSSDEELIMRAGAMSKAFFHAQFGYAPTPTDEERSTEREKYYRALVRDLIKTGRIIESENYYRANPRDRNTAIATDFDVAYPHHLPTRSRISPNVSKRDRYLLWYAAAKHDLSGSKGDTVAIMLICQFLRLPRVARRWREFIGEKTAFYKGKWPEETK